MIGEREVLDLMIDWWAEDGERKLDVLAARVGGAWKDPDANCIVRARLEHSDKSPTTLVVELEKRIKDDVTTNVIRWRPNPGQRDEDLDDVIELGCSKRERDQAAVIERVAELEKLEIEAAERAKRELETGGRP